MAGALGVVLTGDTVPVEGRHAIPVYVDDSLPIVGPSRACVVTTGEVPQAGGAPIPVRLAPAGTPAIGPALPVYVVSGSLGGASAPAPVNTVLPVVSGTAELGATLTTTDGTWTNSPTSYTYQWKRGGVNIGGATNNTYVIVTADLGTTLTAQVTATNAGGSAAATSSGTAIPAYLLLDRFTTNAAAPLASPRTCEPGPGTLTLTQNDGQFSIVGNALVFPAQSTPVNGDQGYYGQKAGGGAFTRAAGLVYFTTLTLTGGSGDMILDWHRATSLSFGGNGNVAAGTWIDAGRVVNVIDNQAGGATSITLALSTAYQFAYVLRSAGAFLFLKGGAFTEWTLIWTGNGDTTASLYPIFSNVNAIGTLDNVEVQQLAAPYITDWGIADSHTASAAANATLTHRGYNALIYGTWQAVTGETLEIDVRRIDDNNRWIVRGSQGGSTIKLIEVNAGVETERATPAQTWTNGTSYRVGIVIIGSRIQVYVAGTRKINYNSSTLYNSALLSKTNKALTSYDAFPYTTPGAMGTAPVAESRYLVWYASEPSDGVAINTYRIPAVVKTSTGRMLAFCEARRDSGADIGNIGIAHKYSDDGGITWAHFATDMIVNYDATYMYGNPCPIVKGTRIWLALNRETLVGNARDVFVTYSDDDGVTWAALTNISASAKPVGAVWHAVGPGAGIVTTGGRIVVPFDYTTPAQRFGRVFYSDDDGANWVLGAATPSQVDECAVVELSNGNLMLNCRRVSGDPHNRMVFTSTDGGATWGAGVADATLIDPYCDGAILNVSNTLYFSNPADASSRTNIRVRKSTNDGSTWSTGFLVSAFAESAAYSDLAAIDTNTIGCLWESSSSISFSRVPISGM